MWSIQQGLARLAVGGHRLAGIGPARVGRIEAGPGAVVEWEAQCLALDHGIPVALVGHGGETAGLWSPRHDRRAGLHLAQARGALDAGFATAIARALVDARIRNMRTQLFRLNKDAADAEVKLALATLKRQLAKLPGYPDVAALGGPKAMPPQSIGPPLAACAPMRPHLSAGPGPPQIR